MIFLGLTLGAIGFVFDAAMGHLQRIGSRLVVLELSLSNRSKPLRVGVDRTIRAGQALLNAFMAQEAQRKEDSFNQGWMDMTAHQSAQAYAKAQEEEQPSTETLNETSESSGGYEPATVTPAVPPVNLNTDSSAEIPLHLLQDDEPGMGSDSQPLPDDASGPSPVEPEPDESERNADQLEQQKDAKDKEDFTFATSMGQVDGDA